MSRSTVEHRLLSERYRIEEFLGHGGMARVYRGTDLVLGRTVAVKVLNEQLSRDPQAVRRFRREAQAAAGLGHPGIVAVFDTGSDGDVHYIVMEYVTGRTIADALREEGPLAPESAVAVASAVAASLGHAHAKGIVHRDIKPANIMRTPSGEVKVMDFGIARAASSDTLTQTATIVGTASYLAPEQARGDPVDARTDVYSLGVVLYEMFTGRPPFVADSPVAVAYKHVREDPVPPSRVNPKVGPGLDSVVLTAMAKDPAARYQTADAMGEDLNRVGPLGVAGKAAAPAAGEPTRQLPVQQTAVLPPVVVPAGGEPRPSGPRSRRPRWAGWVVALGALAAIALVAGLILAGISSRRPGAARQSPRPPATSIQGGRPATSPSPSQGPVSIQDALDRLGLVITRGLSDGSLSQRGAEEVAGGVRDALKSYQHGNLPKAIDSLDKLQGKVSELASAGDVGSGRADELHQSISDLEAAMQSSPPTNGQGGDGDGGD
jgi:tRNA A-37 threonylcarbamoyl transferase component Bud32